MDKPSLVVAISKLAVAGEQAGFTVEEMIKLLDHGGRAFRADQPAA